MSTKNEIELVEASTIAKKNVAQHKKNLRTVFSHIPAENLVKNTELSSKKGYTPLIIQPNWNGFHYRYWNFGDNKDMWLIYIESTTQEVNTIYGFWFKKSNMDNIMVTTKTLAKYPDLPVKELLDLSGYRRNWFVVDNDYLEEATKKKEGLFRPKSEDPKKEKAKKAKEESKKLFAKEPKKEVIVTNGNEIKTEFIEEPESFYEEEKPKEIENEVIKMDNTAIEKYDEDSSKEELTKVGKTYTVKGKETPDSNLAQQWANEKNIKGEIKEYGIDEFKCWVKTRATSPNGRFVEDVMIYDWETLKEICFLDMIENAKKYGTIEELIIGNNEDGSPKINPDKKFDLYKRFVRLKHFAIRDLASKSYRRAFLKVLNKDWTESEEEKDLEDMEKRIVENS